MSLCVVCGTSCGPLNGQAKSWACAGKLARQSSRARALRDRYSADGKIVARETILRFVAEGPRTGGRVLDLWGGGLSARGMKDVRPDLRIHSFETDRSLWAAMEIDAAKHDYTGHRKDFRAATGLFDFIWLDLCSQLSNKVLDDLKAARSKLRPGGEIAVTLMPERESDVFLAQSRPISIPAMVTRAVGRSPLLVLRYDRGNGHEMWLLLMGGGTSYNPIALADAIEVDGEWAERGFDDLLIRNLAAVS